MRQPPTPDGLGPAGAHFWKDTVAAYELDAKDRPVLLEICRLLDELDGLTAAVQRDGVLSTGSAGQTVEHPALAGLRAHRQVLDKLFVRLGLPDAEGNKPLSAAQIAVRTASNARWEPHRRARATGTE